MPAPNLRIAKTNPEMGIYQTQSNTVRVTAGESLALLMHASRTNRAWLGDFADETIEISRDMYDVLLAYKRIAYEENSRAA